MDGNWLTIIGIAVGAGLVYWGFLRNDLKEAKDRTRLADIYDAETGWDRYRAGLNALFAWADAFFEAKPHYRFDAWNRCLQIALIYPIVLFSLGWAVSGEGQLGDFTIFAADLDAPRRWAVLAIMAGLVWLIIWFFGKKSPFASDGRSPLHRRSLPDFVNCWAPLPLALPLPSGVVVVVVVGTDVGTGLNASGLIFDVVADVDVGVGAGAIARGDITVTLIFLCFFVVLPLLNSVLDYLSLLVTRGLLERARRVEGGGWRARAVIAFDLGVDLIMALVFLAALAALLPVALAGLNLVLVFAGGASVDWLAVARRAAKAPWSEGLMVTGMLFTTLIPTAVHLVAGLMALLAMPGPGRDRIVGYLRLPDDEFTFVERGTVVRYVVFRRLPFSLVAVAVLLVGAVTLLGLGAQAAFNLSFAETLLWIAEWSYGLVT